MKRILFLFLLAISALFQSPIHAEEINILRGEFFNLNGSVDVSTIGTSFNNISAGGGNGFYILFQAKTHLRLGGGKMTVLNNSNDTYLNFDGGGFLFEVNLGENIELSTGALLGAGDAVLFKKESDTPTAEIESGKFHRSRIYFVTPQLSVGFPVLGEKLVTHIGKKIVPYLFFKRVLFISGGDYIQNFNSSYLGINFSLYF